MNQTLKISITRGGCRFATPLYLGAKYVISFDGERSGEASSVLFTKPRSEDATKAGTMSALAQSEYDSTVGGITLNLNKQVLLDWFKDNGACDVDGYVDAHCYVFDADGAILADAGVAIEWKPVQFVVDESGIAEWGGLDERITAVEGKTSDNKNAIDVLKDEVKKLDATDKKNLQEAKDYAKDADDTNLAVLRGEIGELKGSVTSVQMVHEEGAPSTGNTYHKVTVVQEDGVWTLGVKQEAEPFSATDTGAFAMLEADQNFTGANTFTGSDKGVVVADGAKLSVQSTGSMEVAGAATFSGTTKVPTAATTSNDTTAASTSWVRTWVSAYLPSSIQSAKTDLLKNENTWSGAQTFAVKTTRLKAPTIDVTSTPTTAIYEPQLLLCDKNLVRMGAIEGFMTNTGNIGISLGATKGNANSNISITYAADETSATVSVNANKLTIPTATISSTAAEAVNLKAMLAMGRYLYVYKNVSLTTTAQTVTVSDLYPNATYTVWICGMTKNASYYNCYCGVSSSKTTTVSLATPSVLAYAQRIVYAITVKSNASGVAYIYNAKVANANIVVGTLMLRCEGFS